MHAQIRKIPPKTFVWPSTGIALQLPEPVTDTGEIDYNDDAKFEVNVTNISSEQYDEYVELCKSEGFMIEPKKTSSSFSAYNDDGYHLRISYYSSNKKMEVRVDAPEEMGEISWPKSEIASKIPVPKSTYGKINWERESGFLIYIGYMTLNDFNEYADECYEIGFSIEYERGDKYFRAYDIDGNKVNIEYRGNNIIAIRMDAPIGD